MKDLLFFAACFLVLALSLVVRLIKGPSVADRQVAADSMDILTDMALVLYALYTGRSIYIDVAMVTAVIGFIGNLMVAKYLEGGMDK